jgi:hypothetical protein
MFKRINFVTAACVLALLLTACDTLKISEITSDPGRFQGKDVTVAGRVTSLSVGLSVGTHGAGLYQIDDGTGKLVVLSETRGAPAEGTYVGVKGRIIPTFTFMGKSYVTVLRESDRRAEKHAD